MARINPIPLERMTALQRRVNDQIAGRRGGGAAHGPFGIWLRTPALAEKAAALGDQLRGETTLPRKLLEIAVLTVARHWTAQYEWHAHVRHANAIGIDPAVIEAIRTRKEPVFRDKDEAIAYRVANELCETRALADDTYARAVDRLGEQTVVDLVTTIGFYVMVAIVLVGFRVDILQGDPEPLPA
jgi:4-carboxymuconolactone decarboxylase